MQVFLIVKLIDNDIKRLYLFRSLRFLKTYSHGIIFFNKQALVTCPEDEKAFFIKLGSPHTRFSTHDKGGVTGKTRIEKMHIKAD